ncbi:MAG: GNAT family N-acetyltransferase [Anaerolineae bacterium]|nr:GNAT family N-acetyltransferase [Anaerolineae bacterium]
MLHELDRRQFQTVIALFDEYLADPMLYAVLEGRRSGRVFADDALRPAHAFVWTDSESAYLASRPGLTGEQSDAAFLAAFQGLILEEIIPQAQEMGLEFLSLFSFPDSTPPRLEQLFAGQLALRTPVNTFVFDEAVFRQRHNAPASMSEGLVLRRIDRDVLAQPGGLDPDQHLTAEIAFYWGALEAFYDAGIGYCAMHGGEVVSWCYVQAFGHDAHTLDIWTRPDHRGKGLGTRVGAAVIEHGLKEGYQPFWICDDGNQASRRLAEGLGFRYAGDLFTVDIPFEPYDFYRNLATYFYVPAGRYRQAAEAYERALTVQEGTAEDHYNAAVAWSRAGEEERALDHLRQAGMEAWPP